MNKPRQPVTDLDTQHRGQYRHSLFGLGSKPNSHSDVGPPHPLNDTICFATTDTSSDKPFTRGNQCTTFDPLACSSSPFSLRDNKLQNITYTHPLAQVIICPHQWLLFIVPFQCCLLSFSMVPSIRSFVRSFHNKVSVFTFTGLCIICLCLYTFSLSSPFLFTKYQFQSGHD